METSIELKVMEKPQENKMNNEINQLAEMYSGDEKNVVTIGEVKKEPKVQIKDEGIMTANEFAINLLKSIAGTGSLAIPCAFHNVGIIWGILLFGIVTAAYILSSYQLIISKRNVPNLATIGKGVINTNNDYARLCYVAMGKTGYYIYNASLLITLYGACIGMMVVMSSFLNGLPFTFPMKSAVFQVVLTILIIFLCLLKDLSVIVQISKLGLFALGISFLLLLEYGIRARGFSFELKYLYPLSLYSFLDNIGTFVYALGFTAFLLSQVRYVKKAYQPTIVTTIGKSVLIMAVIYSLIGIVFYSLYNDPEGGVESNVLKSLPSNSWENIVISILMVITVLGSFPLFMSPIHEVDEQGLGPITTGKYIVNDKKHMVFRSVEICGVSLIAYLIPNFGAILNFIGNSSCLLIATILPGIIHIKVMKNSLSKLFLRVDYAVIAVSVVILIICTVVSFKSLINTLTGQ